MDITLLFNGEPEAQAKRGTDAFVLPLNEFEKSLHLDVPAAPFPNGPSGTVGHGSQRATDLPIDSV